MRWKCSPPACACRSRRWSPALRRLVWPVTLFPGAGRLPRAAAADRGRRVLAGARQLDGHRAAGGAPPGGALGDRAAPDDSYYASRRRCGTLALFGPRGRSANEDRRRGGYRVLRNRRSTICRYPARWRRRRTAAPRGSLLKQIAGWPGMAWARRAWLLNALYLGANPMVSRSGAAAGEPRKSLFGAMGGAGAPARSRRMRAVTSSMLGGIPTPVLSRRLRLFVLKSSLTCLITLDCAALAPAPRRGELSTPPIASPATTRRCTGATSAWPPTGPACRPRCGAGGGRGKAGLERGTTSSKSPAI